jgi:hypothetical protein
VKTKIINIVLATAFCLFSIETGAADQGVATATGRGQNQVEACADAKHNAQGRVPPRTHATDFSRCECQELSSVTRVVECTVDVHFQRD